MLEARLLVDDPENWVKSIAQESRVKIMEVKAPRPGLTQNFVELASEGMTTEELLRHIRKSGGVVRSDLSKVDKNRVMGTVTTHDCPVCSTFAGLDCFLVSASTREGGKMEWTVFVSGESGFKALCKRLDRNKVNYSVLETSHHMQKKQITSRQEDLMRIAFDLGYFEFPKRINLEHLSAKLGISIATLSEILRRGEKNILSKYFNPTSAQGAHP
jgi:predicted DNA binding protein